MTMTPARRLLLAVALWTATALLVVAWWPTWPLLVAEALALFALVLWDWRLLARTPALTVRRELAPRYFIKRDEEVRIVLENSSAQDAFAEVFDEVPQDLDSEETFFPSVRVAAHSVRTLRYRVCPRVRGDRSFGPLTLFQRSPLGFLRRRSLYASSDIVSVYPDTSAFLCAEALHPKKIYAMLGIKISRRRGEGSEFESLREYVLGDDPRRIDWLATARRGRPITRLYQSERNHKVLIAVDSSRLMGGRFDGRTKLDYAIDASLALAYAALHSGDRVSMLAFDREVHGMVSARNHQRDLGLFINFLRPLQPRMVEADFEEFVRHVAARERHRSLLVILTDFVEADSMRFARPLAVLTRRHRVLLVAIRDSVYKVLDVSSEGVQTIANESQLDLYRRLAVNDLLKEREMTLGRLRQTGLHTLDLFPNAITTAVLNRYLTLRQSAAR